MVSSSPISLSDLGLPPDYAPGRRAASAAKVAAQGRRLEAGLYGFSKLSVGDWAETATKLVTAELIDSFAALSGDRFAIHMDAGEAQARGFPDRVAHGLLILSLIDGMKNEMPVQFDAFASLGWDWAFSAPVLLGDTIQAVFTLIDLRPTRQQDRGVGLFAVTAWNQAGDTVQAGTNALLLRR